MSMGWKAIHRWLGLTLGALALVLSQVVLSFGIPFALIPLVALTASGTLLGRYRSHPLTTAAGVLTSAFLVVLNAVLLWLVFTGR